ncbi:MAG TPA: hypothetical protein VFC68_00010 [Treponemataceae bacterium]|nr:hypothetical protein [Treponemataceae bacterium]
MTWKEFLLKSYAYKRMSVQKWQHTRFIAYRATIAPYLNPKFIPKTINKFMPLDNVRESEVSDETKDHFKEHFRKYLEQKANRS